ncbi:uncharacterized protein [Lepisosteus oculatus]|uniref:uncharacterized protein isoform X2 n=1 Tax=Lepisosteus oculatus TaxID=7918 RepID=UPI0035F52EE5
MDSEQKGNVQLFTGECLFLPVTICVVSEDEEDSWSFSDNSIKEGDYNSSDVDGDLTKLDACTSQEKSRASPYWLVDMNKFQDVQKGASKIVPDAIIQKVIGQKKKLFEENDARLQSKKDSDLKVSKQCDASAPRRIKSSGLYCYSVNLEKFKEIQNKVLESSMESEVLRKVAEKKKSSCKGK